MLATVLDVMQDARRTVILASHDLVDVERIADRLVLLEHGRIVQEGPIAEQVSPGTNLEEVLIARGWGR